MIYEDYVFILTLTSALFIALSMALGILFYIEYTRDKVHFTDRKIVIEYTYHIDGYNTYYTSTLYKRNPNTFGKDEWIKVSNVNHLSEEMAFSNLHSDFNELFFEDIVIELIGE